MGGLPRVWFRVREWWHRIQCLNRTGTRSTSIDGEGRSSIPAVSALRSLWIRVPIVVRAILVGGIAALLGTSPWAFLVSLNLRHGSAVPWAVAPTALYLWLYVWYARGKGWPRSTAEARRATCRWNRVPEEVWGPALFAGLTGLVSVLLLQGVLGRLVRLPQQQDIDPTKYPLGTVFLWVLMSSLVAGVTEETAFRGYMQRPIERRHGPVVAVLVTGVLFG